MTYTTLHLYLSVLNTREFLIEMKSGPAYYRESDNLRKIKEFQWKIKKFLILK